MNILTKKLHLLNTPVMALLQLSAFCILMIVISFMRSANITYFFLAWNLFLAWVPLIIVKIWSHRLLQKPLRKWKSVTLFGFWLLFFPNSPYLITDLVHLDTRFNDSIWSDTLLLFSLSFAGLVVGLYSLHLVHKIVRKSFSYFKSWLIILMSLILMDSVYISAECNVGIAGICLPILLIWFMISLYSWATRKPSK